MNSKIKILFGVFLIVALACGLFACAASHSMAAKHPVTLAAAKPVCSDCHTDWKTTFDHRSDYLTKHKFLADQQREVCSVCHEESFCADCHAHKEEIKPSDKFKDTPERSMPHKGDYINQHKIDGKVNPGSCFPCHGRENNDKCRLCHR